MGVQPGRQSGQKHKHRRAEVRREAGEEQGRLGTGHRHRVGHLHVQVQRLAYMIEQHDQHDQAAQHVDDGDARADLLPGRIGGRDRGLLIRPPGGVVNTGMVHHACPARLSGYRVLRHEPPGAFRDRAGHQIIVRTGAEFFCLVGPRGRCFGSKVALCAAYSTVGKLC